MSTEIWGTFSVRDHLADRAFIADVLLYDRLVIPTLPESEDPHDWPQEWNLTRQQERLQILGDLAIPIPWTIERRQQWQARFDDLKREARTSARADVSTRVAFDVAQVRQASEDNLPFHVTRMVLAEGFDTPADDRLYKRIRATAKVRPGSRLETVAAYTSFDSFQRDIPTNLAPEPTAPRHASPTAIFAWDFFIPASEERGEAADRHLLEKAVRLARRADFIEMREHFYQWLADVTEGELLQSEAREEMEKRLAEYRRLIAAQEWKKVGLRAVKVADAFAGGIGLVNEVAGHAAEAFLGSADVLADEKLKPEHFPQRLKVAAMFHDAQHAFGWKPLRG